MADETENIQCSSCGASLRAGAVFCHKCGVRFTAPVSAAVVPAPVETVSADTTNLSISNAWFKEEINDGRIHESLDQEFLETVPDVISEREVDPSEFIDTPVPAPVSEMTPENDDFETVVIPAGVRAKPLPEKPSDKQPLTAAAEMRRKPKLQKEKIEVVWEQPDSGFNLGFVIGTIIIFVIVLSIVLGVYFVK